MQRTTHRSERAFVGEELRVGHAVPAVWTRLGVLALLALLLGAPVLLLTQANRRAIPFPGGVILGPGFRGQVPLASGATLDVSDRGASTELEILRPAPPGRRYRWMVEHSIRYSELIRDYGGNVDFQSAGGKRVARVSQLWRGFVRVER